MNITLGPVRFAACEYLLLLPIVCFICIAVIMRFYKIKNKATLLAGSRAHFLLRNFSIIKCRIRGLLFILATLFLYGALLRPQWGEREQTCVREGRDLLIGLDISRSMLATDCSPNRLETAKQKIRLLVKNLESDRIGLLIFSDTAQLFCPFTHDYAVFDSFLDLLDSHMLNAGSTQIETVLDESIKIFQRMPDKKNRLCVIVTDGEDFSRNLKSIKDRAQSEQIQIVTFAIGTTHGAPIPQFDQEGKLIGHITDEKGQVVISRLNELFLQNLASDVGGTYVLVSKDDRDIKAIKTFVEKFEKEQYTDTVSMQLYERYSLFAAVSFCLFLIEWLI